MNEGRGFHRFQGESTGAFERSQEVSGSLVDNTEKVNLNLFELL